MKRRLLNAGYAAVCGLAAVGVWCAPPDIVAFVATAGAVWALAWFAGVHAAKVFLPEDAEDERFARWVDRQGRNGNGRVNTHDETPAPF